MFLARGENTDQLYPVCRRDCVSGSSRMKGLCTKGRAARWMIRRASPASISQKRATRRRSELRRGRGYWENRRSVNGYKEEYFHFPRQWFKHRNAFAMRPVVYSNQLFKDLEKHLMDTKATSLTLSSQRSTMENIRLCSTAAMKLVASGAKFFRLS